MNFSIEAFLENSQEQQVNRFCQSLKQYDNQKKQELESQGWQYIKRAERTVTFSFGTVTFSRNCFFKDGRYYYPVDEYLELLPYERYSKELLYYIATLASRMSYRKVVLTVYELKQIHITKDTVLKAVKYVGKLYEEQEDYMYYEEKESEKKKVDVLYIEGDGQQNKTRTEGKRTDYAHFVVHEGCEYEYGKRKRLKNKKEFYRSSNYKAREELHDYLYEHYQLDEQTLVITNSDMGIGYTVPVFEELVAPYLVRHEHFWDRYHLYDLIKGMYKNLPTECYKLLIGAIRIHDKQKAKTALDTAESLIEDEVKAEEFSKFSKRILDNFAYTKPPELRGFLSEGIGINESQHCKITNRTKNKGMRWCVKGAETMGRMIIDIANNKLKELFFGDWRQKYKEMKEKYKSASTYLRKEKNSSSIRHGKLADKYNRGRRSSY